MRLQRVRVDFSRIAERLAIGHIFQPLATVAKAAVRTVGQEIVVTAEVHRLVLADILADGEVNVRWGRMFDPTVARYFHYATGA